MAQVESAKPAPQEKAGAGVEEEIQKLEQQRNQAILHGDSAALDRMASDDYTFINTRGALLTKTPVLEGFKSGAIKFETRQLSDLNVRVHGNAAVVTGSLSQKWTENGKDTSGEYRFTRVYVKERGRWVSAALQETAVAKQ